MCKLRSFLIVLCINRIREICAQDNNTIIDNNINNTNNNTYNNNNNNNNITKDESVIVEQSPEEHWNSSSAIISDIDPEAIINSQKIGLFLFTQYCGPGDRVWRRLPQSYQWNNGRNGRTYHEIDACCKQHDECPNYIENAGQHSKFSGLSIKPQMFARLQCSCDGGFYKCLANLGSRYANAVAIGYGLVQHFCFDLEHPVQGCNRYSAGFFGMRRCEEYIVDTAQPKSWQWFDLPPAFRKIYDFPRTISN